MSGFWVVVSLTFGAAELTKKVFPIPVLMQHKLLAATQWKYGSAYFALREALLVSILMENGLIRKSKSNQARRKKMYNFIGGSTRAFRVAS